MHQLKRAHVGPVTNSSPQPERIVILAGLQSDGTTYRLDPLSRRRLREEFPSAVQVPSVFIGYDTEASFLSLHGPIWGQVVTLLTGLSLRQVQQLGDVIIRIPSRGEEHEVVAS